MNQPVIQLHFPTVFLVLITFFLSSRERTFNRRIRKQFHALFIFALLLMGVDVLADVIIKEQGLGEIICFITSKAFLCPAILLCWAGLMQLELNKRKIRIFFAPVIGNIFLLFLNYWTGWYFYQDQTGNWQGGPLYFLPTALFLLTSCILLGVTITGKGRHDKAEYSVIAWFLCVGIASVLMEYFNEGRHLTDSVLSISCCVYYYYISIQTYQKDALTKILNRHHFDYDLEELEKKSYSLSIVDIDNFKMINDKYGHQKGDEALVTVVRVLRDHLLRNSKLYRVGGDEFAIVSRETGEDRLEEMFEQINLGLSEHDLRVSYGYVIHQRGEKYEDTIRSADSAMYANKRKIKSEDIWDDMTGLFNLRGVLDELETLKKLALSEKKHICLVSVDIERLGNINMAYGFSEGNSVITSVAAVIKSSLEMYEFAGHLGSDEFIVALLVPEKEEEYQKKYIEKLSIGIKNCPDFDGKEYTVNINTSWMSFDPAQASSLEDCVNQAIAKNMEVKDQNRKTTYTYNPFDEMEFDQEEEKLALDIIENNRLRYALQPIVSAKDGTIIAYEALMRSNTDPELSPLTILRYAAKNKKNYDIEKLTLFNILGRLSTDTEIPEDKMIFVNSIPSHVLKLEDCLKLTQKYPGLMKRVVVEITEQSVLDDEALNHIRERQRVDEFKLAIDDFGSGNSNTYTLLRYKPDFVKLDRLLITDIDKNTKKQYFVNSIITFAKENGMSVLAEGVETLAELKMLIRLHVDYIQGYYTARPSFDVITEIDSEVKRQILNENIRSISEGSRKIFIASNDYDISMVQLALDEYTGITVSTPKLRIIGNSDYVSDMCIKIKDGLDCEITMKDVKMNSIDDLPCIDIGENAKLTLYIEGSCFMNRTGIHVPESATLILKGSGELTISTQGHYCYCIGGNREEAIGTVIFRHSGNLKLSVDGEVCAVVGAGKYLTGDGIIAESGSFDISVAGVEVVGIGTFEGDIPILFKDIRLKSEFRVNRGNLLGSFAGMQRIELKNFKIEVAGSGTKLAGIGSIHESGGSIKMESGSIDIQMSGQEINLVGVQTGDLNMELKNVKVQLKGEGDTVLGFGSFDKRALIHFVEAITEIVINSRVPLPMGAVPENFINNGPDPIQRINL